MNKTTKKFYLVAKVISSPKARVAEGTIKVEVQNIETNLKYQKQYKISKRYQVHYPEKKEILPGTIVKIADCAPISKTKRFCIMEIMRNVTERK